MSAWTRNSGKWLQGVTAGVLICGTAAAEPLPKPLDRTALEAWIETKRLISEEKQKWRTAKIMLEDRIELIRQEAATLVKKTAEARQTVGEADKKLAELQQRREALVEATSGLQSAVADLEKKVRQLLARVPAPLRDQVKPLSQRMPEDPNDTTATLSERFQNIVGVLNEINKSAVVIREND